MRVALLVSQFNPTITERLTAGAREALLEAGVEEADILEYSVAGAFELAPACRQLLDSGLKVDAVVALGAVVRGETPHFTFVAEAAARGLQRLATEANVPVVFGVLTTDTRDQAEVRADPARGNKGGEAVRAALSQADLYRNLRDEGGASVTGFEPV
jgi:6,7-dimethyl-8-ribityllumazine synthase